MPTELGTLEALTDLAREVVERVVWCTVTTVSPEGEPRSRLMHPVWSWDGGTPTALVTSRPTALKRRHLEVNDRISCFYWDPAHDTVAIDATARWLADEERTAAWESVTAIAPPVGFDPAMIWPDGLDSEDCAFLRFMAHRLVATPAGQAGVRWG